MRTHELEVRHRVLRHADLVEGSGEEGGKGGDKGYLPPRLQTNRSPHHVLLGDEHLEKTVLVGFLENLGLGRVADLAVEAHDLRELCVDPLERTPIGVTCRSLPL